MKYTLLVIYNTFQDISLISWFSVLLMEVTWVFEKKINHKPWVSQWQSWSYEVVSRSFRFKKMCFMYDILNNITNLVCYAYFHWLFNPECQHIFGKQTGYICTFSVSLIWAPKNNNNVVDKNRNNYASLNQYHNTD